MDYLKKWLKQWPVTVTLTGITIAIFLFVDFLGPSTSGEHLLEFGACYTPWIIEDGQWYRIFASMFLHFGMEHLLNNMLVLLVLGTRLEPLMGHLPFALVYLLGGTGGNLVSLAYELRTEQYAVSAGASGAVFSLMGGAVFILLRDHGHVQDLSSRQVLVMAAMSLYLGFASTGVDNAAHVGGLVCGFLLALFLCRKRRVRKRND